MAIEVRIPTILRNFTDGEKAVEGKGDTLGDLFADLDARHQGLRDRLVGDGRLNRFVNVYLNDEDPPFTGGAQTPVPARGGPPALTARCSRPSPGGPEAPACPPGAGFSTMARYDSLLDSLGRTPLVGL